MKIKKLLWVLILSLVLVGCKTTSPTVNTTETLLESEALLDQESELESDVADAPTSELIKLALEAKYPAGEMDNVTVESVEETDNYFKGNVVPAESGGGGLVFAAKNENGEWEIVADGNGIITCVDIEGYDFPVSMIPGCYDEELGEVVPQ